MCFTLRSSQAQRYDLDATVVSSSGHYFGDCVSTRHVHLSDVFFEKVRVSNCTSLLQ